MWTIWGSLQPIYEEDLSKEEIIELIEKTSDDKKYSLNDVKNIVKDKFKIWSIQLL